MAERFLSIVANDDVRMLEPRDRFDLSVKPRQVGGTRHSARVQELERSLAFHYDMLRQIDNAHPAFADHVEQLVLPKLRRDHSLRDGR